MASVVDIMDKAFYEVLIDGERIMDKAFMVGIFDGITKKLCHYKSTSTSCLRTNKAAY